MARKSQHQVIEELLDRYDERLKEAFLDSVADIADSVTMRVVVERLERGDIDGAIAAIQLEPEAFARFEIAIQEAYNAGGTATVDNLPMVREPDGNRVIWRFGVRNREAEQWLRDHSSDLVTRIVDDQRTAIRQALTDGLEGGQNPRTTALDVVGRIDRRSNRRKGGVIGLSSPQERYVTSARQELLSGDPEQMRHYLTRVRRDKRFDRTVLKAIRDEKPLDQEAVSRITGRYADRLLELRGEMLARTETLTALGKSREDAIRQQIASGKIAVEDVTKVWHSAADDRVRHTHRFLNGDTAPLDGYFRSISGAMIRYPGDPNAPASEIIGCRCWLEYKIDYMAGVVRRNRAA